MFSDEFSLEPENLQPQNRSFVRGFRQFSAHLTKRHACHRICAFSPLQAALTMRFAKNEPQNTSKVLRLPHKMTMMVSKVLRLPWKMQRIFWKLCKSIAHSTQNDCPHVRKDVWMSRSATLATRNEAMRRLKPWKATPFAELTIGTAIRPSRGWFRTVASGCTRSSQHTLNPQTPRVKREPLLRIRGKGYNYTTRTTWLRRGFTYYEQTEWLRITPYMSAYHALNVRSRQQDSSLIGGKHERYNHEKANMTVPRLYLLRANHGLRANWVVANHAKCQESTSRRQLWLVVSTI